METRDKIPMWMDAIGKGWHPILEALHTDLAAIDPNYKVIQVKEKFGGLRVYLDWLNTEYTATIGQIINVAEALALGTCEDCGGVGSLRSISKFYVRTLCEPCLASAVAAREALQGP